MSMLAHASDAWPELDFATWKDTYATLHLWLQIVGKIRLAHTPWTNHSWHVPLYVTARGVTTGVVFHGERGFELAFDLIAHELRIDSNVAGSRTLALRAESVADFDRRVRAALAELGLPTYVSELPSELPDPIPFSQDRLHASYDPGQAARFFAALLQADRVLKQFRTEFLGKCSPVHFFWGSFDLAVTRFSGRPAPLHPGGIPHLPLAVAQEAYSHEVSSAGFWPGNAQLPEAVFYSYAYPTPEGMRSARVQPAAAYFHEQLGEFILPYSAVRSAEDPDRVLLDFLHSTYDAAADLAHWNRRELECSPGVACVPRRLT